MIAYAVPNPHASRPPPILFSLRQSFLRYDRAKQKLTIGPQKAEMKRKLATVTPDIYNGLDLIVGSPEFNQVWCGV